MRGAGRALWLASVLAAAGCAHNPWKPAPGERGEVIEAEGWAPLDAADPLGTKRRSLADAQKKAVELVVGVFISAKTRVDQTVSIDERILANVDGYIRRYKVLGERREDGFLKTKIKALVLYQKIGDDLKRLGLEKPPAPPGDPRVRVTLRPEPGFGEPAAKGLRRALLSKGLLVVDGAQAGGDDLLVDGDASVNPVVDERLGGLRSARARLSLEVRKSRTGEVLLSRSQEASAVDVVYDAAIGKALELAGSLAGEALAKEAVPLLKSQLGVAVRIQGVESLEEVRKLADDIRLNPGVEDAVLSDYGDGRAEIRVTTESIPGDELAAMILRSKKFRLAALSTSAYAVELKKR